MNITRKITPTTAAITGIRILDFFDGAATPWHGYDKQRAELPCTFKTNEPSFDFLTSSDGTTPERLFPFRFLIDQNTNKNEINKYRKW